MFWLTRDDGCHFHKSVLLLADNFSCQNEARAIPENLLAHQNLIQLLAPTLEFCLDLCPQLLRALLSVGDLLRGHRVLQKATVSC